MGAAGEGQGAGARSKTIRIADDCAPIKQTWRRFNCIRNRQIDGHNVRQEPLQLYLMIFAAKDVRWLRSRCRGAQRVHRDATRDAGWVGQKAQVLHL
jgi:hypothetical protein